MTTRLDQALDADAAAGRALVTELGAAVHRAAARVRRRRRVRLAGAAAILAAAVVGVPLVTTPSPAGDPSGGGAEAPAGTAAEATVVDRSVPLTADQLLGTVTARTRADGARDAQRAVVCGSTAATEDPMAPCRAVWVGERPLISLENWGDTAAALVSDTRARIEVNWLLMNNSGRPLALERGDLIVALTTDPAGLERGVTTLQDAAWGASLWVDDSTRLARHTPVELPEEVAPREYMAGTAVFEVGAPAPGAEPDPLWLIATGQAAATLTVQVGLQTGDLAVEGALILEASSTLGLVTAAVTGDSLLESFTPRGLGDAAPEDRQAALLCPVPEALRVSHFTTPEVPYRSEPVDCEAGWVDGPVIAAETPMRVMPEDPGVGYEWTMVNLAERPVYAARTQMVVEAQPAALGEDELRTVGTTAASATSAWRDLGSRTVMIDNAVFGVPWSRDSSLGTMDSLLGTGVSPEDEPLTDAILAALDQPGTVTVQVSVPFVDDPTRIMILEVPMPVADASASAVD